MSLYPLRFEPIFHYRPWGGRRLAELLDAALPGKDPIGESWLLSDREDDSSVIVNGRLKGEKLRRILEQWPQQLLGKRAGRLQRFPLLLKFLDARGALSVQVHPSDAQTAYLPRAETGKTEAWVVMAVGAEARIYAGLAPGTSAHTLREALATGKVAEHLAFFTPRPGDAILIPAGTVHSLRDMVVFEIQENSDVTFRLYDWDRIDAKTQERRPLQVEQAMACIDFTQVAIGPAVPVLEQKRPALREQLIEDPHFRVWRLRSETSFPVGATGTPHVLVCLDGAGQVKFGGADYLLSKGEVMLLPAVVGSCPCQPLDSISLLEISLPEGKQLR
jgi:mannose-6-phosphate isomerase